MDRDTYMTAGDAKVSLDISCPGRTVALPALSLSLSLSLSLYLLITAFIFRRPRVITEEVSVLSCVVFSFSTLSFQQ